MNPLMNSLAELKRLELNSDIKLAYAKVKRELGEVFDDHMKNLSEEIINLQNEAKPKISYYIAGIILTLPPDGESGLTEENNDDFAFYSMMVKAAIGWGLVNGLGEPYHPLIEELKEL